MFTTEVKNVGSNNSSFPDQTSLDKEAQITKLIGDKWYSLPKEEEIDQAFTIAKTMEDPTLLQFTLSDICTAYLKLYTIDGCKKACEVAKYKEKQGNILILKLLDEIVGVCINLKKPEALSLAKEIFKSYPQTMACSDHKHAFKKAMEEMA